MQTNYVLPQEKVDFFNDNGYVVVEDIITPAALDEYRELYNNFLSGAIDTGKNRTDLGIGLGDNKQVENITQIMWPSDFIPGLLQKSYHQRSLQIARQLLGNDLAMDFDMLINKAPHTNTPTPWHQDAAYWINMPDKRAASCWLALDNATLNNGCMWYVPASHLAPLRPHTGTGKGGALTCEAQEAEGLGIEIKAGTCIFHHGHTLHYSRGNSTDSQRRAYIVNFRPEAMIELERAQGFDHGRSGNACDRKVRNDGK